MYSKMLITKSTGKYSDNIKRLREALDDAEAVVVGAGAGLSASAGFTYTGERFERYFSDFAAKYGFQDMYSGGFYPYSEPEEFWAYWSRYIFIKRYMDAPKPVYENLLVLFLELGVGYNTPAIIKYPFWRMTAQNPKATYACVNYGQAVCPEEIAGRSVYMDGDIEEVIRQWK